VKVWLVRSGFALGDFSLHRSQLLVAVHDVVNSGAAAVRTFLCDVGDYGLRVQGKLAIIRFQFAKEHGEQR
jgi:hypothetical protein